MVEILGTTILPRLEEVFYLIVFIFVVWVVIKSGEYNGNYPYAIFNEFNNLFFVGTNVVYSCSSGLTAGLFDATPIPSSNDTTILGQFQNTLIGTYNTVSGAVTYVYNLGTALMRLVSDCGIGFIRVVIGLILLIFFVIKAASLIQNLKQINR